MSAETFAIAARYDRAIAKEEKATVERINTRLADTFDALQTDLTAYYEANQGIGSLRAQMEVRRSATLAGMLLRIDPTKSGFYATEFKNLLTTANRSGTSLADELKVSRSGDDTVSDFSQIPFAALAAQARDGVERLKNHTAKFRDDASAIIEQGLVRGEGPQWMKRQLKQKLGVTQHKAETIARTEASAALNTAAQQRYADGGLKHVQIIATPSRNLCPFCAGRNGNVYPIGKISVPLHPRCFCLLLPWDEEWAEAGLTDDEFVRDYHDKRNAELRSMGLTPNLSGAAPFEKMAGAKKAPRPSWTVRDKVEAVPEAPKKVKRKPLLSDAEVYEHEDGSKQYSFETLDNGDQIEFKVMAGGSENLFDVDFTVNGGWELGEKPLSRKNGAAVAMRIMKLMREDASQRPDGLIYRTEAARGDGLGDRRERMYRKIGFSSPLEAGDSDPLGEASFLGGEMHAVVRKGKLVPLESPEPTEDSLASLL